jgi:hypothetical protein
MHRVFKLEGAEVIIFYSVQFLLKKTKIDFKKKPKLNRYMFLFGYFGEKISSNRFSSVFSMFCSVFSSFTCFFFIWVRFFRF